MDKKSLKVISGAQTGFDRAALDAALLDALKAVERLIFIGDPRQLPPIGADRPFVDIVSENGNIVFSILSNFLWNQKRRAK